MAHEARYAFKVGDKLVTMTVEASTVSTPKCCVCGDCKLEKQAYDFLCEWRRENPKYPGVSAGAVAWCLGVSYHKATKICMGSNRIKLEAWHVNSPRYTCRNFYV